jgi:DNA polymerase-1
MRGTFLQGCILESHHNGRVHSQFNQLKSEEGGTVTGRFSSSRPDLQFIPTRTEEANQIRAAFLPETGQSWGKLDYSQIEYRLIAHDAYSAGLNGAEEVVRRYNDDPTTDFHDVIAKMTGLNRASAKTINFGLAYGEGVTKLAGQLRLSIPDAEDMLRRYHSNAPFIRPLAKMMSGLAGTQGEIRTLMQRKRRFHSWSRRQPNGELLVLDHYFPGSQRAFLHKALNARIQGGAADIMKLAMVRIYKCGVLAVTGVPHMTVHDELDLSIPRTKAGKEALQEVRRQMEEVVAHSVPLKVDVGVGKNWGVAH